MQKRVVSLARSGGFRTKKRRFLKMIRIFVGIKILYPADYQRLSCNAENKRFLSMKDNVLANIGCICCYNSRFVEFIHNVNLR